jgi:hypothetical protein
MTQLADITVKNGAPTPADTLFGAVQPQSGGDAALWYYKAGPSRNSYVRLTTDVRRTGSNASTRARMQLNFPVVVENVVQYSLIAKMELVVPDMATQQDVDHMYAFMKNLIAHAQLQGNFKDLSASL